MNQVVKNVSSNLLYRLKSVERYSKTHPTKGAIILMYHHITRELFRQHVKYLSRTYKIISLDELNKGIDDNNVPSNTAVVTFDDGFKSNYTGIFPVVKEFKIPVTIYLVSKFTGTASEFWFVSFEKIRAKIKREGLDVKLPDDSQILKSTDKDRDKLIKNLSEQIGYRPGERSALNWSEVLEMQDSGYFTFGSHTHTHAFLTHIDDKRAEDEILLSKKMLEKKLNNKLRHFAYPNGNYRKQHVKMLKEAGFKTAVTANPGVNTTKTSPFLLYRIGIGTTNSVPVLAVKASAMWYELNKIEFDWDSHGRTEKL